MIAAQYSDRIRILILRLANTLLDRKLFIKRAFRPFSASLHPIHSAARDATMTPDTIAKLDPATADAMRAFEDKVSVRSDFAGLILFGSRARNTHRADSDADVAVLLRGTPGKFVTTKLAMDDLAYDVLLDTGIRIQPLPVWESEWNQPETYSNPWLLKNIAIEGIRL